MSNNILHKFATIVQLTLARLRFLAVFLVVALVVGYWDNIKNHVDKWTRPAVAPDPLAHASEIEYFCPMHPEVIRDAPGQCPKCGMPLVKRKKGEKIRLPDDVLQRVQLTPQRIALADVQTSPVEMRVLHRDIRAVGVLDFDETRLARLTARVAGRADELFVSYTGQAVKRGEPLYSLYSPEVYNAQREYLSARKRVNDMPKDAPEETRTDASAVYNASLQKLALWGVTTEQLDQLDQEFDATGKVPTHLTVTSPIAGVVVKKDVTQGQYLQAGDAAYSVADLSSLWLQVKLYERDIPLVRIGDGVEVNVDALPAETFGGHVDFVAFQLDPETRTLDARVVVKNPGTRLRPGMLATAKIRVPVIREETSGAGPGSAPTTATAPDPSQAYGAALKPYLAAHKLLTEDKSDGVPALLKELVAQLEPFGSDESAKRVRDAIASLKDSKLESIRESWKEISAGMIELGKSVGVPPEAASAKIFRCPMKKALWIQLGDATANPYYGSEMYTCGSAVESLPKASRSSPTTRPLSTPTGKRTLAVPRSAVIDTGTQRIVYVESAPGSYDMKNVKLGPIADDFYPVIEGLHESDRVVTTGTFLIDAEQRLNPSKKEPQMNADEHGLMKK